MENSPKKSSRLPFCAILTSVSTIMRNNLRNHNALNRNALDATSVLTIRRYVDNYVPKNANICSALLPDASIPPSKSQRFSQFPSQSLYNSFPVNYHLFFYCFNSFNKTYDCKK